MSESEFLAVPQTFTIDIGQDGGTLTIDQSQPVITYQINGEAATEAQAWEWVYHWHTKRDDVLEAAPCRCTACAWFRSELKLRAARDAE